MDLKEIQTQLFNSLDELENIGDIMAYNSLANYCLHSYIKNEGLELNSNELSGLDLQNELLKDNFEKTKQNIRNIYSQLRDLPQKA